MKVVVDNVFLAGIKSIITASFINYKVLSKCMRFQKGNKFRLGIKHTEETKRKMSESHKGNKSRLGIPHTEKIKKQISKTLKGRRIEHLTKIGFKKDYVPWNKGIPLSEERKKQLIEIRTGCKHTERTKEIMREQKLGNKNPKYINGITSYRKRALENFPHKCNQCGIDNYKVLLVHHKDGNRKNNDLKNLEILCLNCHALRHNFNTIRNLGKYAIKKELR